MSEPLATWWLALCAVSLVNLVAWSATALTVGRDCGGRDAALRRTQLLLSAGYVFGCAFRSWFPVYDVPRLCLVDGWWSNALVGRTVATVAELCFVAQWSLLLRRVSRDAGSPAGEALARALLPMIAFAELCSWYAVLSTSNLGHVVEESIWGGSVALLVLVLLPLRRRVEPALRPLLLACIVGGALYVAYMFGVDVPMYWSRWLADEAAGRDYLGLAQGVRDAAACEVSHRWEDWRSEVVWMSAYFSVAVWLSIALVRSPLPRRG